MLYCMYTIYTCHTVCLCVHCFQMRFLLCDLFRTRLHFVSIFSHPASNDGNSGLSFVIWLLPTLLFQFFVLYKVCFPSRVFWTLYRVLFTFVLKEWKWTHNIKMSELSSSVTALLIDSSSAVPLREREPSFLMNPVVSRHELQIGPTLRWWN